MNSYLKLSLLTLCGFGCINASQPSEPSIQTNKKPSNYSYPDFESMRLKLAARRNLKPFTKMHGFPSAQALGLGLGGIGLLATLYYQHKGLVNTGRSIDIAEKGQKISVASLETATKSQEIAANSLKLAEKSQQLAAASQRISEGQFELSKSSQKMAQVQFGTGICTAAGAGAGAAYTGGTLVGTAVGGGVGAVAGSIITTAIVTSESPRTVAAGTVLSGAAGGGIGWYCGGLPGAFIGGVPGAVVGSLLTAYLVSPGSNASSEVKKNANDDLNNVSSKTTI
ncbi:MAG: hypothetical protein P4L31_00630 [Candidatus Babeliales bacterium]|nr:hypothetical protein [Candidatus Babeliales bacterium]